MIISIASGKGGTGKTTIAVNLALVMKKKEKVMFLDCDVEEPNAHIFLKPELNKIEDVSIPVPSVDLDKCIYCGKCEKVCEFNAIIVLKKNILTFPELCHGCGACALLCPENAITEEPRITGEVEKGISYDIDFIHGKLYPPNSLAPPVIKSVKKYIEPHKICILDAPPGNACPMLETVQGTDFCVLVTEPTPFGLNDLKIAVEILKQLKIKHGVVINRDNIGNRNIIERFCNEENICIIGRIPFDKKIAELYSEGMSLIEFAETYDESFNNIYNNIMENLLS